MPITTIEGHDLHVDEEGFLTRPSEWDEDVAVSLARQIGVSLTDDHWRAIHFLRDDYERQGETATLRRVAAFSGISIKRLFELFPQKPAKKLAYVAGLPKPHGCV